MSDMMHEIVLPGSDKPTTVQLRINYELLLKHMAYRLRRQETTSLSGGAITLTKVKV